MFNLFDDRWAHVESDAPPGKGTHDAVLPRYWVPASEVKEFESYELVASVRKITNTTNMRTFIGSLAFDFGYGDSALLMSFKTPVAKRGIEWLAYTSSYAFDFIVRNKLGGTNVTFMLIKQLAMPKPGEGRFSLISDEMLSLLGTSVLSTSRLIKQGVNVNLKSWDEEMYLAM